MENAEIKTNIKTTLGRIIGKPIRQFHNGQQLIVGYEFQAAVQKLARDPISVKDRYAIGRTLDEIEGWVKSFQEFNKKKIEELGVKTSVYLMKEIAKLEAQIKAANESGSGNSGTILQGKQVDRMKKQLDEALKNPQEPYVLDPENTEALDKFNAAVEKEMATEILFEYLDHKIFLPQTDDRETSSKLDGNDMQAISELITV